MGGRGSDSSTSKAVAKRAKQIKSMLKSRADKALSKRPWSDLGRATKAAEGLIGDKKRVKALLDANDEFHDIMRGLRISGVDVTPNTGKVLSTFEEWTSEGARNRPMHLSQERWEQVNDFGSKAIKSLNAKGFSTEEVAGYLMYEKHIYESIGYKYR